MGHTIFGILKWVVILGFFWLCGDRYGAFEMITNITDHAFGWVEGQACNLWDGACLGE